MLSELLREATRANHRSLEERIDFDACLSAPEKWLWLLRTFRGYWSPVEARVLSPSLAEWLPDVPLRRRAHRLDFDIKCLGGNPDELPVCTDLPSLETLARKIGSLYVSEGSTLGAQLISRAAALRGYTAEHGCSFFAANGGNVGSMWKSFQACLNAFGIAHPEKCDEVVSSAVNTFEKFGRWAAVSPVPEICEVR